MRGDSEGIIESEADLDWPGPGKVFAGKMTKHDD
jgi:hypothetical protein